MATHFACFIPAGSTVKMAPRNPMVETLPPEEDLFKVEPADGHEPVAPDDSQQKPPLKIVWLNVAIFLYLHLAALYSLSLLPQAKLLTIVWLVAAYIMAGMGITVGAHRLWAHRSYKARLPLRILLGIWQTMAYQNHIFEWSRDHRVHHKYSETNADPHNAKRGFFFSHIGWLMVRKHPDVITKGKTIDMSDLLRDPVVVFQKKYYKILVVILCFVMPAWVPWYFWGEGLWNSFYVCSILRYVAGLNATWLVNSAAHMWGMRPYDKRINPAENMAVSFWAVGEGFHNYHHTFPQDYSTSEFGWRLNISTAFIDAMAYIGQAYDRRKIPKEVVEKRRARTGDKAE